MRRCGSRRSLSPHINLLELKAFLKEEKRLCGLFHQKSCLSALDSQVCLGALVKGRSSSPAINRALRQWPTRLDPVFTTTTCTSCLKRIGPMGMADDVRLPEPPDFPPPHWIDEVARGDYHHFDRWISSLGPEFSLAPLRLP